MKLLVLLALVACGRRERELDQPPDPPPSAPVDAAIADAGASGGKKLGETCGVGVTCAGGLTCYRWNAADTGGFRATCELACGADGACPTGTTCEVQGGSRQPGVCRRK